MKLLILENCGVHGAYHYAINSPSAMGGSERQEWLLAQALGKKYDVSIVSPAPPENPRDLVPRIKIDGVEFIPCAPRNNLLNILNVLNRERPDWLYVRCSTPYLAFWFLFAKLLGIHTIFSCASDFDCRPLMALSHRRKRYWPLYACGLLFSDCIFIQHSGQFDLLSSYFKKKAFQVNNIVEIKDIEKNPETNYIAWVGGIRYEKRPDLLIEIALQSPNLRFMVGGGIQAASISPYGVEFSKQIIEKFKKVPNITYLGNISHTQAIQLIANGKIFLMTSESEGFPNVLLEAWSVRTPVISLGIDPGNVIRQNKIGLICTSAKEAVVCLQQLIQTPSMNFHLVKNGLQYIREFHSPDTVLRQFNLALNSIS